VLASSAQSIAATPAFCRMRMTGYSEPSSALVLAGYEPDGFMVERKSGEIAEYVGEICLELQRMADEAGLELLAHLLSMTALESTRYSGEPLSMSWPTAIRKITAKRRTNRGLPCRFPVCQTCRRERVVIKVEPQWGGYAQGPFHCRICKATMQIRRQARRTWDLIERIEPR
jgi:hypothetical protein